MTSPRHRLLDVALLAAGLGLASCSTLTPQARAPAEASTQAATLIAQAEAAMGSAALKTLSVTGQGMGAAVGQAHAPGMAWPAQKITVLSRSLNFETARFREEYIRSRAEPLGGGALPPLGGGDARGVVLASDAFAWDVVGVTTVAASTALAARVHDLWTTTPPGALKAAARMNARAGVRREFLRRWDTLSFELPGRFSATLVIEDNGLVSRIESTVADAVLGEMPVVTEFTGYRPLAGLMLPSRIVQRQGGFATLDLAVTTAAADEPVEITVPDNVRTAVPAVATAKVADGVWFLNGGTHNSVVVETSDRVVIVELPLDDAHARLVLDAARRLVPGDKALAVVNTHHHFDHAGGLRHALASGATVFTSALARPYYERVLALPRTASTPPLAFVGVDSKAVLEDSVRTVEIHEVKDSPHARGLLMVWLPRERLLVEADAFTPAAAAESAAAATPVPAAPTPDANALNLVQNLERLGIAPQRILPLRGRVVPVADLYIQAGRTPPP